MKPSGWLLAGALALPALALAETHVVTIEGLKFEPAALTVHRGDTMEAPASGP